MSAAVTYRRRWARRRLKRRLGDERGGHDSRKRRTDQNRRQKSRHVFSHDVKHTVRRRLLIRPARPFHGYSVVMDVSANEKNADATKSAPEVTSMVPIPSIDAAVFAVDAARAANVTAARRSSPRASHAPPAGAGDSRASLRVHRAFASSRDRRAEVDDLTRERVVVHRGVLVRALDAARPNHPRHRRRHHSHRSAGVPPDARPRGDARDTRETARRHRESVHVARRARARDASAASACVWIPPLHPRNFRFSRRFRRAATTRDREAVARVHFVV